MKTLMENWNRFVNEEEGSSASPGAAGSNHIVTAIYNTLRKHNLYAGSFRDLKNLDDIQDTIQRLEDQGYAPGGKPGTIDKIIKFAKYLTKDEEKLATFAQLIKQADAGDAFAVFSRLFVQVAANDAKLRAIGDKVLDAALYLSPAYRGAK